jgi:hypothetical protein
MEDKIREEKLIRAAKLYNFVPSSSLSIGEKCFLDGAKSEAAKQYHQQSSVDLAIEFADWVRKNCSNVDFGNNKTKLLSDDKFYSTEQLHELFTQTKKG